MLRRGPQRPELQTAPDTLFVLALEVLGVSQTFIRARKRTEKYVVPRRKMTFLLYSHGLSYPQIGILLKRNHTSIIYLHRQAVRQYKAGTGDMVAVTEQFDALVAKQIEPKQETLWGEVA